MGSIAAVCIAMLTASSARGQEPIAAGLLFEQSFSAEIPQALEPMMSFFREANVSLPHSPLVRPRSAWNALDSKNPYELMIPGGISIHHTETPRPSDLAGAAARMRSIQRHHQDNRGWSDIAYHYIIDGSGTIWEGRPGPVVGAHVHEKNDGNIGIALMGNFESGQEPTPEQLESLISLSTWLSSTYLLNPSRILSHASQTATSCPGRTLLSQIPSIRDQVRERLAAVFVFNAAPGAPRAASPEDWIRLVERVRSRPGWVNELLGHRVYAVVTDQAVFGQECRPPRTPRNQIFLAEPQGEPEQRVYYLRIAALCVGAADRPDFQLFMLDAGPDGSIADWSIGDPVTGRIYNGFSGSLNAAQRQALSDYRDNLVSLFLRL